MQAGPGLRSGPGPGSGAGSARGSALRGGLPTAQVFTAVGAGAGLFLALRFALSDPAQTGPIALFLMVALVAHLLDLRARWGSRA